MAILHTLGKVSVGQDLAHGASPIDSSDSINMGALGIDGFGPGGEVYLDLETEIIATGSDNDDVFTFNIVVAQEEGLTNVKSVFQIIITGKNDVRLATAGAKIFSGNLPDQVRTLAKEGYPFLGIIYSLTSDATLSVNAAFSPSKPRTQDNVQVTRSNVALPTGA